MKHKMTSEKLNELNTQLRILILQNVRVEDEYDERFLKEMNRITQQILELKKSVKNEKVGFNRINHTYSRSYHLHS
ncbi:MAG: hypothetical protein P8Y99_00910 [Calditrichaceae bacterium]|jgi:hypothetical protein